MNTLICTGELSKGALDRPQKGVILGVPGGVKSRVWDPWLDPYSDPYLEGVIMG